MTDAWVNEQRIDSPLENWPGYIVVPKELTPEQFCKWWEVMQAENDDDSPPGELQSWGNRYHLVLDWHLKGLKSSQIEATGMKLPSMSIAMFVISATQSLIMEARTLPNLPAPLNGTGSLTAQPS